MCVAVTVPASERETIVLEPGRRDLVGAGWEAIWKRDDLAMSYVADYERYGPDEAIEISLGVHPTPYRLIPPRFGRRRPSTIRMMPTIATIRPM